jgi:hypothetical protein
MLTGLEFGGDDGSMSRRRTALTRRRVIDLMRVGRSFCRR